MKKIKLVKVIPTKNFRVYLHYENGEVRLYDATPLFTHKQFKPLTNIKDFMTKCCIINLTLAWDLGGNLDEFNCFDLDPYVLYQESVLQKN